MNGIEIHINYCVSIYNNNILNDQSTYKGLRPDNDDKGVYFTLGILLDSDVWVSW